DRAAELRPAFSAAPAGALRRPDDRGQGRLRSKQKSEWGDDERRADGGGSHEEALARRALVEERREAFDHAVHATGLRYPRSAGGNSSRPAATAQAAVAAHSQTTPPVSGWSKAASGSGRTAAQQAASKALTAACSRVGGSRAEPRHPQDRVL